MDLNFDVRSYNVYKSEFGKGLHNWHRKYFSTYLQLPSSGTFVWKRNQMLRSFCCWTSKSNLQYLFSHIITNCWVSRTANVAWAFDSPFPKQPSNHKSPRKYCRLHLGHKPTTKKRRWTHHQLKTPSHATNPASDPRWSMDFCRYEKTKTLLKKGKMWQSCSSIIRDKIKTNDDNN